MENDDLKNKVQSLEAQNKLLKEENDFLREQFNLARHRQFDASCEKASVQPSLFNEPEAELDEPEKVEPQPQESSTTKNLNLSVNLCQKTYRAKRVPLI